MKKFTGTLSDGDTLDLGHGLEARFNLVPDHDAEKPWEREDGHGIISQRPRNANGVVPKKPGEVLIGSGFIYDVPKTLEKARKEGWGLSEKEAVGLTKRQITAEAVRQDMERMRAWLAFDWGYYGVKITLIDTVESAELDTKTLWGVESDAGEYLTEVANQLLEELAQSLPEAVEYSISELRESLTRFEAIAAIAKTVGE